MTDKELQLDDRTVEQIVDDMGMGFRFIRSTAILRK